MTREDTDYHHYIYDLENKKIIGDFEKAYQNCDDVWPEQHRMNAARYRFIMGILYEYPRPYKVLDIGCGYGDFVAFLTSRGFDATGIDISATAVKKGLDRFPDLTQLEEGNLLNGLKYPDGEFDATFLLGVLWYLLDDLDYCLKEVKRVLKKDGLFFPLLYVPEDPIGKEIIGNYEDFIAVIRRHFHVVEAIQIYERNQIAQGLKLSECMTDMMLVCRNAL